MCTKVKVLLLERKTSSSIVQNIDQKKYLSKSKKVVIFERTQVQVFLEVFKQNKQIIQLTNFSIRQLVDYLHITAA